MQVRRDRLDRRHDERHVGIFRLAQRRRDADVDRVERGSDGEIGRRLKLAVAYQSRNFGRRHIGDIGSALLYRFDLARIEIDAGRGETATGELDRQRQSDVPEADHADAGAARLNPIEQPTSAG